MDLPALRAIPCSHMNGLASTGIVTGLQPSRLAYGQRSEPMLARDG